MALQSTTRSLATRLKALYLPLGHYTGPPKAPIVIRLDASTLTAMSQGGQDPSDPTGTDRPGCLRTTVHTFISAVLHLLRKPSVHCTYIVDASSEY